MENGHALRRGIFGINFLVCLTWFFACGCLSVDGADVLRVATYNVENYLEAPTETRPEPKSDAARAKVREGIRAMQPDIIALEEIGSSNALLELQTSLKHDGLDLPNWEMITGADTNIHVAFLSRLPIVARHPHTADEFLLDGRRRQVCRGFAEIEVQVKPGLNYTLIATHLKSRRTGVDVDQAEERQAEAKILRQIIDERLNEDPRARLIVLGDLNDTKDAVSTKTIIGRGKFHLIDTRPAERNGDNPPDATTHYQPRNVTWTHYYGYEDSYSRIDYILISPALLHRWLPAETYIPTIPNWGIGSDHRPIVAAFDISGL
jgi:endonuclease/exonuclease/phosphatase family metal-dependent hydrolase